MSRRGNALTRRAPVALAVLTCLLGAVALAWEAGRSARPARPGRTASLYPKTEPAKNPVTLQLQADGRQVVGWISGGEAFAGRQGTLTVGDRVEAFTVGTDNTFRRDCRVERQAIAEVRISGEGKSDGLHGSVLLEPPPAPPGPSIFFVVDRTAYRPGQALQFAAFLRQLDAAGEFVPVAGKEVQIDLTSERKQTRAARLKLTSDARGRVVGSYTFSDADALDHYSLAAAGYKGSARVLLGEYRKSKVRLKIAGTVEKGQMRLRFEALDFLDKPVPIAKASFHARVVRRSEEKKLTLKAEDFVHHEPTPYAFRDLDSISEEDLLLREAERVSGQGFPGLGNEPLAQLNGELKPDGERPARHTMDLKPDWLRGDCSLIVQGVITDSNNREQRGSATLVLEEQAGSGKALELVLPKQRFFTGEPIEVRAAGAGLGSGSASLIVMKLAFQTPSTPITTPGGDVYFGQLPAYRSSLARYRRYPIDPTVAGTAETVRRTLVTAVPFKGDTARLLLREPGAYKLIAVVQRDEGPALQQETTVVVKRLDEVNPLVLHLDRSEYTGGGRLTGVVHSRFADARALLTVRDSAGIRLTRPIRFSGGTCSLNEPLPTGLRYGCTVDVCYPEDGTTAHVARAFTRIVPSDRILDVAVKTPETVRPGETIDLDLQVNRHEPVDLVVSVYDQALLGIVADRSTDIRNFYLADERANNQLDRALLHRRLGNARLSTLLKKAEALLKEMQGSSGDAGTRLAERAGLEALLACRTNRYVYARDVATLLRLAGVDVYFAPYRYGTNWHRHLPPNEDARVIDLLRAETSGWTLAPRFIGGTLLLHETHASYVAQGYTWHPVYGWNWDQPYGMYYRGAYLNNTMQFNQLQSFSYSGRAMARGDAAMNWNGPISGNSMHSFVPEGQAFRSHMPALGAAVPLLDTDGDQGPIAVRRDFSDSAVWNASVRTDDTGKARVSFKLPDSLTNWQVVVTAVSAKMHVGSAKASFRTFKPVMVWPMLPRTFTEGDRVEVFASVHNRTDEPQRMRVRLKVENGRILSPQEHTVTVGPKSNVPVYWTFAPGAAGFTQLLMSADCPAGSDASLKRLPVSRAAAEQVVTASGEVRDEATIKIPEGVDLSSSRLEVTFAPSLAADMADTLNYLVDYPYGCVEQTMSRFLPAVKVAQILRQFKVEHPELEKKMPLVAAAGIKRLLELQQGDGGWGWMGNGATHEIMTPYALYGLLQAEKAGYQIPNETAIQRGLARLEAFITNMGDAQTADRIYCMYVFGHRRDLLQTWWTWIGKRATDNQLSDYALALALELAVQRDQTALARQLAAQLRQRAQQIDGHVWWRTAGFTRWAEDRFEITAAALKALVAHDRTDPLIAGILAFFTAHKRGDRWNSTKDTAMILLAMTDYLARTEYNPLAEKKLTVAVNGGDAQKVEFSDQLTKKIALSGERLRSGANRLTFRTEMKGVLYRAVFRYWKAGRHIEAMDGGIQVTRALHLIDDKGAVIRPLRSGDTVPRGSYLLSVVEARYRLPESMRYVVVENPKASGGETVPADDPRFAAQHAQCTAHVLREDREAMTCFHLEQTPQALTVRNVFLAELAGEFVMPPARVEMMYQTQTRGHSGSFVLNVTDRGARDAR